MEGSITIHSKRDEQGHMQLGSCTLLTGAGPVVFENGVAHVTPEQAALLANRADLEVARERDGLTAAPTLPAGHHQPALPLGLQDASPDELDWLTGVLDARRGGEDTLRAYIAQDLEPAGGDERAQNTGPALEEATEGPGGQEQLTTPPQAGGQDGDEEDPTEPAAGDTDVDPAVAAAQAALREDGEHVPKVLPQGFEALTAEGEPRCYARKADGSQCANAAKLDDANESTYACGLASHQEQVAKLP